jgi:predicted transglutaminase-like cysteine proteinase
VKFADLETVNERFNGLPYVPELSDDWKPIDLTGGDCDSVATAKFDALVRTCDWPHSALRLAVCYVETGGYHCVLLADLDGQTWVLDNRHPRPMEFQLLPYQWDKIQIAGTQQWEKAS